jgi:hypothetical protein
MRPYFDTEPGVDENIDQSRKMIIDWVPKLNLAQLYGYVSFMSYVAYGKNILDVYQSCSEGLYDTTGINDSTDGVDINQTP